MTFRKWDSIEERFWSKVDKGGPNKCWLWEASRKGVYGQFMMKTSDGWRAVTAHRAAYILTVGNVPSNRDVDHLCRTTLCVNPRHLEVVTPAENRIRQALPRDAHTGRFLPRLAEGQFE